MPLDQVIVISLFLIAIVVGVAVVIANLIYNNFDDPFQSRMIFVTILSTAWIVLVFIACVCKAYSAGNFDREPKSEPQTESSVPKLDYEKN
jgi:cbb3-type cytochrome oxidase subunit 3